MGELRRILSPDPELKAIADAIGMFTYLHHEPDRTLIVTVSTDHFTLEEAHLSELGIRHWRHAAISVQGSLAVRLADQNAIGRQREGGERSPAPLPDWYDLTHVAYAHAAELGFDPSQAVWQYLPAPGEERLNVAEALHLRQPK